MEQMVDKNLRNVTGQINIFQGCMLEYSHGEKAYYTKSKQLFSQLLSRGRTEHVFLDENSILIL